MSRKCILISLILLTVCLSNNTSATEVTGTMSSDGWWMRPGDATYEKWNFTDLDPATLKDPFTVSIEVGVTNQVNGGSGYSTEVKVTVTNPDTGESQIYEKVWLENSLPGTSSDYPTYPPTLQGTDPNYSRGLGYPATASIQAPACLISASGKLEVKIERKPNYQVQDTHGTWYPHVGAYPECEKGVTLSPGTGSPPANPPVADAGPDQTVESPDGQNVDVTLDGSGSYDPDALDYITSYSWAWDSETASDVKPTVSLGTGTNNITLTVEDNSSPKLSDTDTVTINVVTFTDPRPTSTTLALSSSSINCGSQITVTANVTDEHSSPVVVNAGEVTFKCSAGSFAQNPVSVSNGSASTTWTAPTKGDTYTIEACYSGWGGGPPNFHSSEDSNDVQVNYIDVATVTTVQMSGYPYIEKKAWVTVKVKTTTGVPVLSGNVNLSADHGTFDSAQIGVTNGLAWTKWKAPNYTCTGKVYAVYPVHEDPTRGYRYGSSNHQWGYEVVKDTDSRGTNLACLTEWNTDYDEIILIAEPDANGFANKLESDLGWAVTRYPNQRAWETDFKKSSIGNGDENNIMDAYDFTFYCGHGNPDYITFITDCDDKKLRHSDAYDAWGDIDADWAALLSCEVLSHASDWAKTMNGLHLICGFYTRARGTGRFGELFAGYLIKETVFDEPHTIPQAWFLAGDMTQPSDRRQRVIGESPAMFCDYIWGQGKVQDDPTVDSSDWMMTHDVNDQNTPTANAGGPYAAVAGQPIQLDGSGSSDSDPGDYLFYAWDLYQSSNTDSGDWDLDGVDEADDDAEAWGRRPMAAWLNPGTYNIRLMVIDQTWKVDDDCNTVTVTASSPASTSRELIAQTQSNGDSNDIEIVNDFNSLPTETWMPLFQMRGTGMWLETDIGWGEMMKTAEYWGMTISPSAGLDSLGTCSIVDDNRELMINRHTGSVMYIDREQAYVFPEDPDPNLPPYLPDPCQARDYAEDFLQYIGIDPCGYYPSNSSFVVFDGITDVYAEKYEKGSRSIMSRFPFNRHVNFRKQMNVWGSPYPVVGPGGKISVMIKGDHVIKFMKIWRDVDFSAEVELHPASSAIADFHRLGPKALVKGSYVPLCNRIEIDSVSLGYYEDDFVTRQDMIYPVYILELTCEDDKGSQRVQVYMSALAPPLEAVIESPAYSTTIGYGEEITFSGSATGGTQPYTYKWESDFDGPLGDDPNDSNVVTCALSSSYRAHDCVCEAIPHTISLTVTDANGFEATELINVTVRGFCTDFNHDGKVNFKDFAEIASSWLAEQSDQNYDEKVNLNQDNMVDIDDLCVLANEWLNIIDPNLVGYWKFDETGGSTASDSSGNGNHGTLIGDPCWVPGRAGGALSFDGDDDYVDCGNDPIFDITEQITLAVWVKTNDSGNNEHNPYVAKGDHSYAIKHRGWDNHVEFFIYDANWYAASFPVDDSFDGDWHHLVGTYDGSQLKLYLDGAPLGLLDYTGSIATSAFNINIGRNPELTDRFYDGAIDDVRIYNRALTDEEVQALFDSY